MPMLDGQLVSQNTYDWAMLEQSNKQTGIESNKLSLEAAKLANESAKIDNAAKRKALAAQAANAAATAQMTNEFLGKWGDMNNTALEMLQKAISGDFSSPATAALKDVISNVQGQVADFDTKYGGTVDKAYDATFQDISNRQALTKDLMGMSTMDQAGAAGRAATDVRTQSAIARDEMARNAMSYGVDPTSGKFGALQKKSFLNEAKNTVDAMNRARMAEKDRAANMKLNVLNSIDPSQSAGIASDLMNQKNTMLGLQTTAAGAMAGVEKAKSDAITSAANTVAGIGEQYGSLGSTLMGMNAANGGIATDTTTAKVPMFASRG